MDQMKLDEVALRIPETSEDLLRCDSCTLEIQHGTKYTKQSDGAYLHMECYKRDRVELTGGQDFDPQQMMDEMKLDDGLLECSRCGDGLTADDVVFQAGGKTFHSACFACAQCFQYIGEDKFYEFEGHFYCEYDWKVNYAPCCVVCNAFIEGKVIRIGHLTYHMECLRCSTCHIDLNDSRVKRLNDQLLCVPCFEKRLAENIHAPCVICHEEITEGGILYQNNKYHCFHLSCHLCQEELTPELHGLEVRGQIKCIKCRDKSSECCATCHRPIKDEEVQIKALGKYWHKEHFVCCICEKPFQEKQYYEKNGRPYCLLHFNQRFGNICFVCNNVGQGSMLTAVGKSFCEEHFACSGCSKKLNHKVKFFQVDKKPLCRHCFDRLPKQIRERLLKYFDEDLVKP